MMKKLRRILCSVLSLILCSVAFAQNITVTGKVTTNDGKPLENVSVTLKGSTTGTTTNNSGTYRLQLPSSSGNILTFSSVGYTDKEVTQTGGTLNVQLEKKTQALDDVVVVGYGTQKRTDIAGSVASVDVSKLTSLPTSDIVGMLRGQVAGLNITVGTARPGGSSDALLRGIKSLKGSNSPLYVVDGVPISTSINDLDINNIKSISVLKDAASQAIYGSRASNGVVLITTLRGANTDNKVRVSYQGYVSYQNVHANFSLYSPQQYEQLRREAYRGDLADSSNGWLGVAPPDSVLFTPLQQQLIKNNSYVNWLDYAFKKNAPLTKHSVSISGGNANTQYTAALDYYDQSGVRDQSGYQKYSGQVTLDQTISKTFKTGLSVYYIAAKQQVETAPWLSFVTFSPLSQLYDSTGALNTYPTGDGKSINPLYFAQNETSSNSTDRTIINYYFQVTPQFIPGLQYKFQAGYDSRNTQSQFFAKISDLSYLGTGRASITFGQNKNYLLESILSYNKTIAQKHKIGLTFVQSIEPNYSYSTNATATQLGNDYFGVNSLSSELQATVGRSETDRKLSSFVGRANYAFMDKYSFSFSIRDDGSSVFGANNKWGLFKSGGFAWNLNKEAFMQHVSWLDEAKLRVSYGSIGNQAISPYGSEATANNTFYVSNGSTQIGYLPGSSLPNPNLKWETTTTLNTGIDFAMFNRRLTGTIEWYKSNTTDLLVNAKVPSALGYSSEPTNLGEIQNKGIEVTLSGTVIESKNFTWRLSGNISANRNKLVKGVLQDPITGAYINDLSNNWFIGQPINVFYDYQVTGIWQIGENIKVSPQPTARPGDVKVADVNGDGKISALDQVVIKADPKWVSALNTYMQYKGVELSAGFYIVNGGLGHNQFLYDYNHGGRADGGALNGIVQDYWTPEHPTGTFPRAHAVSYSNYRGSLGYQSTAYVRLRNVTLGYNLPDKWLKKTALSRLNIYFSGDNLWTKTNYQSYSPEESNADAYPETINYTVGIKVNFKN